MTREAKFEKFHIENGKEERQAESKKGKEELKNSKELTKDKQKNGRI